MNQSRKLSCMMLIMLIVWGICPISFAQERDFSPGEPHSNTLDFRLWFSTMSAQADVCTLSIHEDIYVETQAGELLTKLSADLEAIRSLTGAELEAHTVYVVEELFAGIQRFENRVYCRAEDIESGAYLEYLIAAALGLEARWKAVGLEECLTSNSEEINPMLSLYLEQSADMDLLSLSEPYFVSEFSDSYGYALARQTAGHLCRYILEQYSFSELVGFVGDSLKTEWLQSIGIDREYADPYEGLLDSFTWENSKKYPLILTSTKGDIFYLAPIPDDMETPSDVRAFLYEAIVGPQKVIDGLRMDAPEYAEYMEKNFARPIKYYIEPESNQYSYTNWAAQEIHIGFTGSIIHESMHLLTRVYATSAGYYMNQWKVEGIAEYLTLKYGPSIGEKEALFWEMTEFDLSPSDEDTERDALLKETVQHGIEFYREQTGALPERAEDVDAFLYNLSMAKAFAREETGDWASTGDAFNELNGKNISLRFINGLTYDEVFSFSEYIIRTYSLEKFLDYCMNPDAFFDDFYGISYEEAMEGWYRDMFPEE